MVLSAAGRTATLIIVPAVERHSDAPAGPSPLGAFATQFADGRVRKHPTGKPHPALPSLVGETKAHRLGKPVPLMVPPLFLIAWIAILVLALR